MVWWMGLGVGVSAVVTGRLADVVNGVTTKNRRYPPPRPRIAKFPRLAVSGLKLQGRVSDRGDRLAPQGSRDMCTSGGLLA